MRSAAADPHFLAGVLDFVLRDDATVKAFAAASELDPTTIAAAREVLVEDPLPSATCRELGAAPELAAPTCFCRDCLVDLDITARRCGVCGSPRLVRHRALPSLALAHIDCDAFYATVEKRDNPELADKPVIIGGGKRGVVLGGCYISRTFGVRSAMPMFKALALCPSAIVIRPDMAKYVRVGREVRHAMQALTPLVEPLSIDEAFLDLSGTQRVHGMIPAKVLARFAREVEREHRDHGFRRAVLQQVPGQDRLRHGQAARLCRARSGRGARDAGGQAGRIHLRRRPSNRKSGCRSAAFAPSPICSAPTKSN